MAYCGVLDCIITIGGVEADLSRLDEGVVVAGDEVYDAEDLITDEDRLSFFNEVHLRTKAELLKDIDDRIAKNAGNQKEELLRRFRAEVEKRTFPGQLEDWWYYDYSGVENGVKLSLCHSTGFSINLDDTCDEVADTVFDLMKVSAAE